VTNKWGTIGILDNAFAGPHVLPFYGNSFTPPVVSFFGTGLIGGVVSFGGTPIGTTIGRERCLSVALVRQRLPLVRSHPSP
jgi:hypothetical protein